jgi:thiol-disulfide isomerase/thioredoxin
MLSVPALVVALATAAAPAPRGEVIDFSATWCGPCQQMAPLVARLEREGLPIRKVDIDQDRAFANRYSITAMPTFVLVIDGKEVDRPLPSCAAPRCTRTEAPGTAGHPTFEEHRG